MRMTRKFAVESSQKMHLYRALNKYNRLPLKGQEKDRMWRVRSTLTKDRLGLLPLVPGMPVMITENTASTCKIVNGSEGILREIKYTEDEEGRRYAACAYVEVPGCCLSVPGLEPKLVPLFPMQKSFLYKLPGKPSFSISRTQLPLLPGWSFTDYIVQGASMDKVIIDLASATKLQDAYVMLLRAKSLKSVAILRWFPSQVIYSRLQEDARNKMDRLAMLDDQTREEYDKRHNLPT
ncbi:hypothetical protein BV22DRAFT_1104665 [Leucogyrophana mollusca]|uniref:Uncharacterized protein n=1 Tax=Leucogyrophana mollusca TaxID=85980 RepID=A0ACB8BJ24_9AGAM|nr:hypothetical protein BV22DRAFT_1104665 [Leucogyrophana mollusca]